MHYHEQQGLYKGYSIIEILYAILLDHPFIIECLYLYPSDSSYVYVNDIKCLNLVDLILNDFQKDGCRLYEITNDLYKIVSVVPKNNQ